VSAPDCCCAGGRAVRTGAAAAVARQLQGLRSVVPEAAGAGVFSVAALVHEQLAELLAG